jgi:hypothetical protein
VIRLAHRADLIIVRDLLIEFLKDTSYAEHTQAIDPEHISKLAFAALHTGLTWLLFIDDQAVGLLVSIKEQNIWMPKKYSLRELVWYVKPEHRSTASAGRLFVHYAKEGERLLNIGDIDGYFTTRMSTTGDYDLQSRGWKLTEKLYLKDKVT